MGPNEECECGRMIERRAPKCRQCMIEWAANDLGIDLSPSLGRAV